MDRDQQDLVAYLEESFSLDGRTDDPLKGISESDLRRTIGDYRELSLKVAAEKESARKEQEETTALTSSGFQSGNPSLEMIRRSSLYFDRFTIDDPLVRLARQPRDGEKTIGRLLGLPISSDLHELTTSALAYMRKLLPAVKEGFLEFQPMSVAFDPPRELLLSASDCFFEDTLPNHIMNWFWSRVKIKKAKRTEAGSWVELQEDAKGPTRAIWVSYEGHERVSSVTSHLKCRV